MGKTTGLDAVCDRKQILVDWDRIASQPRPKHQGSDNFLKKQFKLCAHGEIGFFLTKQIISALPDTDEKPIKIKRKATFDGWEREVEEEERAFPSTKEQIKKMHMVFRNNLYMCLISFPQHPQLNVTKLDLDDWYEWFWGKDIAERKPSPSESTLVYAERNAWREIHNKVYEGATLKDATQDLRQDSLFWTREVYERCQTRSAPQHQREEEHRLVATAAPMVQGPGQIRALASQRQGEVQDERQGQGEVIMALHLGHGGAQWHALLPRLPCPESVPRQLWALAQLPSHEGRLGLQCTPRAAQPRQLPTQVTSPGIHRCSTL